MDWTYDNPALVPLTVKCEGDEPIHTLANGWTCMRVDCICKWPGQLAGRDAELRRARTAAQQGNETTTILPHSRLDLWNIILPDEQETIRIEAVEPHSRSFWRKIALGWRVALLVVVLS
jgi:hypothetical protein